jgi:hypothetical protein
VVEMGREGGWEAGGVFALMVNGYLFVVSEGWGYTW